MNDDHSLEAGPWMYLQIQGGMELFWPLPSGESLIGRSHRCDYYLPDETISREHAKIFVDEKMMISDLGSRNGTFLNEVNIKQSQFQVGDCIRLGSVNIQIVRDRHGLKHLMESESTQDRCIPVANPAETLLTPAQYRVFQHLANGLREKRIAAILFLSPHTVHNHIKEIYRALDVKSHVELIRSYGTKTRVGNR